MVRPSESRRAATGTETSSASSLGGTLLPGSVRERLGAYLFAPRRGSVPERLFAARFGLEDVLRRARGVRYGRGVPRDPKATATPTAADLQVLSAIDGHLRRGERPTIRAIAAALGQRSPGTVQRHVTALLRTGRLARTGDGLVVGDAGGVRPVAAVALVPLVGQAAAGLPIVAAETLEGHLPPPPGFVGAGARCFALRVRGDSMTGAGIDDGDIVYVAPDRDPGERSVVVVRIDDGDAGEVTVKRMVREGRTIRLVAANPAYADQLVNRAELTIEGVVVAVLHPLV